MAAAMGLLTDFKDPSLLLEFFFICHNVRILCTRHDINKFIAVSRYFPNATKHMVLAPSCQLKLDCNFTFSRFLLFLYDCSCFMIFEFLILPLICYFRYEVVDPPVWFKGWTHIFLGKFVDVADDSLKHITFFRTPSTISGSAPVPT